MFFQKMLYKPLFLESMVDEITLDQKSHEWLRQHNYTLDINVFSDLHKQVDLDVATRIMYSYLIKKNQNFIELIQSILVTQFNSQRRIKILIIPGMYYHQHPEIGADGKLFFEIATKLGFAVERVNTHSLGTISQNTELIKQAVNNSQETETWLISLSKGSLEVRSYLQQTAKLPANLRGWINIGGICFGSPLADFKLTHPGRRLLSRMLCNLLGINYKALAELCTYNPEWQKEFLIPPQIKPIHVVALPIASQISSKLQPRYARLCKDGPNDGMILLRDYLRLPGHIYPIWGVDHLMRPTNIGSLLYKLYYIIHQNCYKDIRNESSLTDVSFSTSNHIISASES